jgi:hypothetical protein
MRRKDRCGATAQLGLAKKNLGVAKSTFAKFGKRPKHVEYVFIVGAPSGDMVLPWPIVPEQSNRRPGRWIDDTV